MDFPTALLLVHVVPNGNEKKNTNHKNDYECHQQQQQHQQQQYPKNYYNSPNNDDDCCFEYVPIVPSPPPTSTTTNPSMLMKTKQFLSYHDMIHICQQQHYNYIHESIVRNYHHHQNTNTNTNTNTNDTFHPNDGYLQKQPIATTTMIIVMAYIVSSTNIDYLISILAAMRFPNTTTTTTTTTHPMSGDDKTTNTNNDADHHHHHNHHQCHSRKSTTHFYNSKNNHNHHHTNQNSNNNDDDDSCSYQMLPVLIPTKWTISEMVRVLQIPPLSSSSTSSLPPPSSVSKSKDTSCVSSSSHITILIHDHQYQSVAYNVGEQLKQQQQATATMNGTTTTTTTTTNRDHRIQYMALPNYAHDWMMNDMNPIIPMRSESNHWTSSGSRNSSTTDTFATTSIPPPQQQQELTVYSNNKIDDDATTNNTTNDSTGNCIDTTVNYEHVSNETAMIVFTSGTTSGIPQGVCISHRAMYVQCQMKQMACNWSSSSSSSRNNDITNNDSTTKTTTTTTTATKLLFGTTIPIYHIGGIINYYAIWYCRGTLCMPLLSRSEVPVVPPPPKKLYNTMVEQQQQQLLQRRRQPPPPPPILVSFDPYIVFQSLMYANTLVVVPTMLHAMESYYNNNIINQESPHNLPKQFTNVKGLLIGGQSANHTVLKFVRHIFPHAQILQTYACTEATSSLTYHNVTTPTSITPMIMNDDDKNDNSNSTTSDSNLKDGGVIQKIGQCIGCSPSEQIIQLFLWNDQGTTAAPMPTANNNNGPVQLASSPNIITKLYTPGIIVSRGPHIMNGYWTLRGARVRRPDHRQQQQQDELSSSTKNDYSSEYLITNDIGYWSSNNTTTGTKQLYYIGRRNTDTIRTGGETVWCTEVEQILQHHQQIIECSVFGLPDDEYYGEVVCCAIVVVVGAAHNTPTMTIDTIRSFCADKGLAGYKRPRHLLLYIMNDNDSQQQGTDGSITTTQRLVLPRNANGKVLKYQLKQKLNELLLLRRPKLGNRTKGNNNSTTTSIVYINNDATTVQSKL